jgi:hypothetical protein
MAVRDVHWKRDVGDVYWRQHNWVDVVLLRRRRRRVEVVEY